MCDVIKKMSDHMPESFLWLHILLAAYMAVFTLHRSATVQAILFFSLGVMRHSKIWVKNKYKKYKLSFFFVTEQFR